MKHNHELGILCQAINCGKLEQATALMNIYVFRGWLSASSDIFLCGENMQHSPYYNNPSLIHVIKTPFFPKYSVLVRHVSFCDREYHMY